MPRLRPRPLMLVGILVSVVLTGLAVWRLLHADEWVTPARRIEWRDVDGQPIADHPLGPAGWTCAGPPDFGILLDGSRAWVTCSRNVGPGQALAVIDLDTRVGRIALPFDESARPRRIVGVLPTGDGLAFVWRELSPSRGHILTVAIAGDDHWLRPPSRLAGEQRLLGMGLREGVLELAVQGDASSTPPSIWSISHEGEPEIRAVDPNALGCQGSCRTAAAYMHADERRWRFIVEESRFAVQAPADVAEDGTHRELEQVAPASFSEEVDPLATGIIKLGSFKRVKWRLTPNGELVRLRPSARRYYEREGAHLKRASTFFDDAKLIHVGADRLIATAPLLNDRSVAAEDTPQTDYEYLSVGDGKESESVVARVDGCYELPRGMLIPSGDDFILLEPGGCYVRLDASLRRTDPWGALDHLRKRGSTSAPWKLGFVLFALPIVLGVMRLAQRRVQRPWEAAGAVWLQVAIATWFLSELWALLR